MEYSLGKFGPIYGPHLLVLNLDFYGLFAYIVAIIEDFKAGLVENLLNIYRNIVI